MNHSSPARNELKVAKLGLHLLERCVLVESEDRDFLKGLERCFALEATQWPPQGRIDLSVQVTPAGTTSSPTGPRSVDTRPADALQEHASRLVRNPLRLCSALSEWAVRTSPRHYVFHAGAVARSGRALLLPGSSGSGKTTLTAGLLSRGFELLSDEVGALDPVTHRVAAYPRRLSVREDVLSVLGLRPSAGFGFDDDRVRMVSAREMGGARARAPVRLAMIVAPAYQARSESRLERLTSGEAVLTLMGASCSQSRFKESGLNLVISLARRLPCYRLTYSDLADAVELLAGTFSSQIEARA